MNVRAQRIADAIVSHEVAAVWLDPFPTPDTHGVTAAELCEKYGIGEGAFGTYDYSNGVSRDKAEQCVRNALNRAFKQGELAKARTPDGRLLRRGRHIVFVDHFILDHAAFDGYEAVLAEGAMLY